MYVTLTNPFPRRGPSDVAGPIGRRRVAVAVSPPFSSCEQTVCHGCTSASETERGAAADGWTRTLTGSPSRTPMYA
eukprot:scaffold1745_cov358-Prasinococcus_capsulatus_cf.AAC.4